MRFPRFRLKALMILVFASAMALGAWAQAERMDPIDWDAVRQGSILFVPFFIMVAMKVGLAVAARAKRLDADGTPGPIAPDEPLP